MSLMAEAYEKAAKRHGWLVVGFRDDMRNVARWLCYITRHQPVKYAFFNQMEAQGVPLPTYSAEEMLSACREFDMPENMISNLERQFLSSREQQG